MSTSFVDEYLVKLGSSVDQSGLNRFHQALREAAAVSSASATSIAESFFKAQIEITAGFVAIGSAAVGLVDKVAMADQSYRLLAMHMYISKDAARGLKVAMDALGEPLENLTFDAELRDRARQLLEDQREMAPDGDFEGQMKKIRDIRFEFTRMEVESEYLAMHVVEGFMKALGTGPEDLLVKLKQFNAWAQYNLPSIAQTLVTDFMPVWKDIQVVGSEIGEGAYDATVAFQRMIGVLSGDSTLDTDVVNLNTLATAFMHVANAAARAFEAMVGFEKGAIGLARATYYGAKGVYDWQLGMGEDSDKNKAYEEFNKAKKLLDNTESDRMIWDATFGGGKDAGIKAATANQSVHGLIDTYATKFGVDPTIVHAIAMHESHENEYDKDGSVLITKAGKPGEKHTAAGVFQLTDATAATVGVNSHDTEGNVEGGVKLFNMMLKKFQGNEAEAIGGYQIGGHAMDNILHHKATLAPGDLLNIKQVLQGAGKTGDFNVGDIIIHIDKPGQTNEKVGHEVASRLRGMQVQRNLAEANPWGQ